MLRLLRSEQVILNLLAVLIGVAASVGREGPAVHIGASLASWFGPRLRLSRSLSLTLLGCGVALAVAASFFALEVEIASVVGTIVARPFWRFSRLRHFRFRAGLVFGVARICHSRPGERRGRRR